MLNFLDFLFDFLSIFHLFGNGKEKNNTDKEAREHFKNLK